MAPRHCLYKVGSAVNVLTGYWDVLTPLKRQMPTTFLPMTAMKYGLSVTGMSVSSGWIMIVRISGTKSVRSYSRLGAGDGHEHNSQFIRTPKMTLFNESSAQRNIQNNYTDANAILPGQHNDSAVSWGAIFAGAAAAAALAMLLLMLGTGLGLSSVSPWENHGLSAGTVGVATIAWLMFTQIAASGMGGYLAGRLRSKCVRTHSNETYFRDTAHGFLAWAVAALVSAALLTTTLGAIAGGSAKVVGSVAKDATNTSLKAAMPASGDDSTMSGSPVRYFVNSLFRPENNSSSAITPRETMPQNEAVSSSRLGEVTGIFANNIGSDTLPTDDLHYVAQLVSQQTGLSQNEAEKRVQNIYAKAKEKLNDAKTATMKAADDARKTASHLTFWSFISLLAGAFIASLCATFGGRQRDL